MSVLNRFFLWRLKISSKDIMASPADEKKELFPWGFRGDETKSNLQGHNTISFKE